MRFTDICLLTDDVPALVRFYEETFGGNAKGDAIHSSLIIGGLGIAFYDKGAAQTDMGFDFTCAGTGLMTIGFDVDDVDGEYWRIKTLGIDATEPQLWPWGAKSFRFRDPVGNIIVLRTLIGDR